MLYGWSHCLWWPSVAYYWSLLTRAETSWVKARCDNRGPEHSCQHWWLWCGLSSAPLVTTLRPAAQCVSPVSSGGHVTSVVTPDIGPLIWSLVSAHHDAPPTLATHITDPGQHSLTSHISQSQCKTLYFTSLQATRSRLTVSTFHLHPELPLDWINNLLQLLLWINSENTEISCLDAVVPGKHLAERWQWCDTEMSLGSATLHWSPSPALTLRSSVAEQCHPLRCWDQRKYNFEQLLKSTAEKKS